MMYIVLNRTTELFLMRLSSGACVPSNLNAHLFDYRDEAEGAAAERSEGQPVAHGTLHGG